MIMNLHAKLPQLRTFCDVGANYGHFTHEFLARWGGGGAGASRRRGLAIEPLPHNARVLRRRFKSDRRITVVQAAASHADAEPRQLFGTPFGSERGELLSSPSARFNISEFRRRAKGHWHVVNVTTLNSLVRAHGFDILDLLKIDTEGFELPVLRGATKVLKSTKVVLWECGHFRQGSTMAGAVSLLHELGFDSFLLSNRLPVFISGAYWASNYDTRGWRNCASFNRKYVSARVLRAILDDYPNFAAPINRTIYPDAYKNDPEHRLFNPFNDC